MAKLSFPPRGSGGAYWSGYKGKRTIAPNGSKLLEVPLCALRAKKSLFQAMNMTRADATTAADNRCSRIHPGTGKA